MNKNTIIRLIFVFLLSLSCPIIYAESSAIVFPCSWVGNIDKVNFNEPSGIVFHALRGTLFVVGDEGDLCEIKTDGERQRDSLLSYLAAEGKAVFEADRGSTS